MKKTTITLLVVILTLISSVKAQVAITTDGSLPDNSAMLDIKNTEKGILIPRMTAAERNAISSPANGLLVYVTTDEQFYYNSGTSASPNWAPIGGGDNDWSVSGNNMSSSVTGNVGIGTGSLNPSEKLDIYNGNLELSSEGSDSYIKIISDVEEEGTVSYIWTEDAVGLAIGATPGNAQVVVDNTSGNVGIGTTNANEKLTVNGDIRAYDKIFADYGSFDDAAYRFGNGVENAGFSSPNSNAVSIINNGNESVRVIANGNMGIGTSFPSEKLEIAGQVKITGGNPGNGKVLTSDVSGLASWEDITDGVLAMDDLSDAITNVGSVFLGANAGENDDNLNYNTGIGQNALKTNTSGVNNTATGYASLHLNLTGSNNSAYGSNSLNHNTSGNKNVANGYYTLFDNETGSNNTASGYAALRNNISGCSNVAIGIKSLYKNTDRGNLVAIGDSALYWNGTGATNINEARDNTAIGSKSMYSNTVGRRNTAIGSLSLKSNTEGNFNTSIGNACLINNTLGNSNTAIGNGVLAFNTVGTNNVAIGSGSLYLNESGNNNIAIGASAGYSSTGSDNIFIGTEAGFNEIGNNTLYVDNSSTSTPLIYGEFDKDSIRVNGDLSVSNDIYTSGNYNYDAPQTYVLQLSPASFTGEDIDYGVGCIYASGDAYFAYSGLNLPHNAIITKISIYWITVNSPSYNTEIDFRLIRMNPSSVSMDLIASINLENMDEPSDVQTTSTTNIFDGIIDNQNYNYYIKLHLRAFDAAMGVYGVKIEYTLDKVTH